MEQPAPNQVMSDTASRGASDRGDRIRQILKAVIYSLLLINFVFYIHEDVTRAEFTLTAKYTLLDWASAFATSLDFFAWLTLLFMLELETWTLEDKHWTGKTAVWVHGARLLCIILIAHTVFAFFNTVKDYRATEEIAGVTSVCELADQDLAFVYNLEYTEITAESCAGICHEHPYFKVGVDPVITSAEGLQLERHLALADMAEILLWLLVIFAMELIVRLQGKGIAEGAWIRILTGMRIFGYIALTGLTVYWASLSHWLYVWDMFLWIGGFAAIEMNLSEWREEIREDEEPSAVENTPSKRDLHEY